MNKKLIEQIKALKGVKNVKQFAGMRDDSVVVTLEPQEPVLHDEYGVPIFAGGDIFFVVNWTIKSDKIHITTTEVFPKTPCFASLESAERWIDKNKPKSIYTDPETGDEFFDGDEVFYFCKENINITSIHLDSEKYTISGEYHILGEDLSTSKCYKSRKDCEIALAEFIASKYDKKVIDNLHLNDENN